MNRIKLEECNCLCHNQGMAFSVMHIIPCCVECEYCSKNIILNSYKEHSY